MTRTPALRLAALSGLAWAALGAAWWLGSARLALDDGADTSRSAADALWLVWFVRGGALLLWGLRAGLLRGARSGALEAFALCAPSWPLMALAWSASAWSWPRVVGAELLLLAVGVCLPAVGARLGRRLPRSDLADGLAMLAGVALVAALWRNRDAWMAALP
ncbi:MAG: hypothetical protein KF720_19865 [Rubrivivax sp.]|nr:hypothetical protein [Rubrivivax sp.]